MEKTTLSRKVPAAPDLGSNGGAPAVVPEASPGRRLYRRFVKPFVTPIMRQRAKHVRLMAGYAPLLREASLPFRGRLRLLRQFLRVDWNVLHGHHPVQISYICTALLAHPRPEPGEVFVEAGSWKGGSTAKFSILCKALGYRLLVYDSFEGVEQMCTEEIGGGHDFSGQYAAGEDEVRENIRRYGALGVTTLIKGWFRDTLVRRPVPYPVRLVYIDCDTARGTREVLQGIMPGLVPDGDVFSQDFHIAGVRDVLLNPETWEAYGRGQPLVERLERRLARIHFNGGAELVYEDHYTAEGSQRPVPQVAELAAV